MFTGESELIADFGACPDSKLLDARDTFDGASVAFVKCKVESDPRRGGPVPKVDVVFVVGFVVVEGVSSVLLGKTFLQSCNVS